MKANAKLFAEAFTQVAKLVDQRSPKDVMKYVHAIAVEGQLCLTAGNAEVTICRTIPCDGDLEAITDILPRDENPSLRIGLD